MSSPVKPYIHRLIIRNFKSIGEPGVNLELKPLTLFFGPQGSGKSNILEALWRMAVIANSTRQGMPQYRQFSSICEVEPKYRSPELVFYRKDPNRMLTVGVGVELEDGSLAGIEVGYKYKPCEELKEGEVVSYYRATLNDETVLKIGYVAIKPGQYSPEIIEPKELVSKGVYPSSYDGSLEPRIFELSGPASEALIDRSKKARRIAEKVLETLSGRYESKVGFAPAYRGLRSSVVSANVDIQREGEMEAIDRDERLVGYLLYIRDLERGKYFKKINEWANTLGVEIYSVFEGSGRLAGKFEDKLLGLTLDLDLASYGTKQILPVLAYLSSPTHKIVLIEEPEISLHPESVAQLPLVFLEAIKMGKQIIVTTHSTILPTALSRMVKKAKKEKLCEDPNELIAIYEVTKNRDEGTRERRLLLNDRGYMKEYVSSFYKVEKELLDEWWEGLPSEEITEEE